MPFALIERCSQFQILKHITVHACNGMQSLIREPVTEFDQLTNYSHSSGVPHELCL